MNALRLLGIVVPASILVVACGDDSDSSTGGMTSTSTGGSAPTGGYGGQGGAPVGGMAGNGGNGGESGGAGGSSDGGGGASSFAKPQCDYLADPPECTLHDDCCSCVGLAPGEAAPACDIESCAETACVAMGISEAYCTMAQCVAAADCDAADVDETCTTPPPVCPEGMTASIRNGCWDRCIAAEECFKVTDCDVCTQAGLACVHSDAALSQQQHCVALPDACSEGSPLCECLGPAVCTGDFGECYEGSGDNDPALYCVCDLC
ncbi:MAG: hypothetical protein HOW73_05040 [Polyangiaceae bacterium]|nr:hypothetical protein [Polyangiaceae bacterium]